MIDPTLRDQYELNFLSGLQDQRGVLSRVRKQTKSFMQELAQPGAGRNGMATATTPGTSASTSSATEDDQAIYNRSPTINHNYYHDNAPPAADPGPPPAAQAGYPKSWLPLTALSLLTLSLAGGLAYVLTHQPAPTTPTAVPTAPATPVVPAPPAGSTEYLELR